jgi:hypothetical protein
MKGLSIAVAATATIAVPVFAQTPITTIERGSYVCELPGDASGKAGYEQPEQNFTIESASRYVSRRGSGTYLRREDRVVFSSGARKGETYRVMAHGFLRRVADGELGRLRCVRQGR